MKNLTFVFALLTQSLTLFASDLKSEMVLANKTFHAKCTLSKSDSYMQDFAFDFNSNNNDIVVRANGFAKMPAVSEKSSGEVITLKSSTFTVNTHVFSEKHYRVLKVRVSNGKPLDLSLRTYVVVAGITIGSVQPYYDCQILSQ